MAKTSADLVDATFPLRVAVQVTGLKPELIRAWESRYEAIRPSRTGGGSRRYSQEDLTRLSLLRDVVEAGHRIGKVAGLDDEHLRGLLADRTGSDPSPIERILAAAERMDAHDVRQTLNAQLAERGPVEFSKEVVLPLLEEVGARWERDQLGVATEHFVSAITRAILTSALGQVERSKAAPTIVFATPSGEPHDLGTLVAAIVAAHAGARAVFLGADMPSDEIAAYVEGQRASVIVMGLVTISPDDARVELKRLRDALPGDCEIWIGGGRIDSLPPLKGVERIANLEQLTAWTTQLSLPTRLPSMAAS